MHDNFSNNREIRKFCLFQGPSGEDGVSGLKGETGEQVPNICLIERFN